MTQTVFEMSSLSKQNVVSMAHVWYRSYVTLSQSYKTPEEMALYTPDYFLEKSHKLLSDQTSHVFVLEKNGRTCGFARLSPVPVSYLTQDGENMSTCVEKGILNHLPYWWTRPVWFFGAERPTQQTVMLNQIYLDPDYQKKGLGAHLLDKALQLIRSDYKSLIVEYNVKNTFARAFYRKLGIHDIAMTKDLDQQTQNRIFYSEVSVGYVSLPCLKSALKRKIARQTFPVLLKTAQNIAFKDRDHVRC